MAILSPEELQEIKDKINYGLEHYGDNVAELLKIYKQIKVVLEGHGFPEITESGVKEYPITIANSFISLENRINELQGIINKYEGNFSDIAYAINSRGVVVTEDDPYEIYPAKILSIGAG